MVRAYGSGHVGSAVAVGRGSSSAGTLGSTGLVASSTVHAGASTCLWGVPDHHPVRRSDSGSVSRRRRSVAGLGPTISSVNLLPEWEIRHPRGSVAEGHGTVGVITSRAVLRYQVDRATVVLGSGQRDFPGLASKASAVGFDVVRRRSGGGAVLLRPEGMLWVDLLLPRGDRLWDDDVGRSSSWLGAAWVDALAVAGVESEVHRGAQTSGLTGRAICFMSRAAGEVLCDGRKVIGISQRRDRSGARFQCGVLFGDDAAADLVAPLVDLLGLEPRAEVLAEVGARVGGLPSGLGAPGPDELFDAFLGALGRTG